MASSLHYMSVGIGSHNITYYLIFNKTVSALYDGCVTRLFLFLKDPFIKTKSPWSVSALYSLLDTV